MIKEKMTVYKALCELKTLGIRITKELNDFNPCACYKESSGKVDGIPVGRFEQEARSAFARIADLSARRNAIKRALILSNASTLITVSDGPEDITVTVAEAIDMKTKGFYTTDLLYEYMSTGFRKATSAYNKEMGNNFEKRTDEYLKSLFGKEGTQVNADAVNKAREAYIAANAHVITDPLDIARKITEYESRKAMILDEIDSAISVSNATTYIEFEY